MNYEMDCATQASGFFTALLMILSLLFLTQVFTYLPTAILGAMILVSVKRLIDFKEVVHLFKVRQNPRSIKPEIKRPRICACDVPQPKSHILYFKSPALKDKYIHKGYVLPFALILFMTIGMTEKSTTHSAAS